MKNKKFFKICFLLCKGNMAALQDHDTVCVCARACMHMRNSYEHYAIGGL